MKNSEKYKTLEEREEAFRKVCSHYNSCKDCPLGTKLESVSECAFFWLEQDVEPSSLDMIAELKYENSKNHKDGLTLISSIISSRERIKAIWKKQDEEMQAIWSKQTEEQDEKQG